MTLLGLPDLDTALLNELSADVPCDGAYHLASQEGHAAAEAAAFFIVPPDGCEGIFACESRTRWLMSRSDPNIICRCRRPLPATEWRFVPLG